MLQWIKVNVNAPTIPIPIVELEAFLRAFC